MAAPLPVHEDGGAVPAEIAPSPALFGAMFDRVWTTLKSLYYSSGPTAEQWASARDKFRPRATAAKNEADLETVIDEMVAAQPLIKPVITSNGAVVVSGHPLASEAGRLAFEKGGNVVDAMIAVSFALGVVEPEASGIGGDGSAVLYLKGMKKPTTIEYKDMTPIKATPDNPPMVQDGRIVADGPAAANIPGVVAGLDYLYRNYGSGKVKWEDLVAPAITLADEGFILDEGLPSSIAEGRRFLEKWPEAAKIYLPDGKVPRPGDRFFNKDYATTLRAIQKGGADAFYKGEIAKKIAADMEENGGILTFADLAQYRAIERAPVAGHYRGHTLYAGGPPLSTGIQLFESLHVLENYQPKPGARASTDPDYLHYLVESWKVRDPLRRVADPERWPVEFEEHLTDEHAKKLFAKIDPKKASRYERTPPDDAPATPTAPTPRISTGTTSFAVADADGNMIAVTQTLSTWGGTFYVSKGLGFLYNNHLRSNRMTAGAYGSLVPLMRSSTSAVPTLVFEKKASGEEVPRLAVGCAGNAWIPLSVYNIITGVIDGKLGAQAAIEAPRFLPGRDPADPLENGERIEIEDRFPRGAAAEPDRPRPQVPEDRPQGRGPLRLCRRDHRRRRRAQGRRRRRAAPLARRRSRVHAAQSTTSQPNGLIDPGKKAPAFSLPDQEGKKHSLADYAGQPVVLYFYPKDDTPGCTKESCAFQDNLPKFKKSKAAVLGVSVLNSASKAKFAGQVRPEVPAARRRRSRGDGEVRRVAGEVDVRQEVHGRRAHDLPDRSRRQGREALGRREGRRPRRGSACRSPRL